MIMKQKFANALSLALIVAMLFTSVALADNVQNDVVAGGNDTITSGSSTLINYRIQQTGVGSDGQAGCNASDGSPATVTINTPAGVTVDTSGAPGNQVTLTFTTCGVNQGATFTSSTPGNYTITVSVTDSGAGSYSTNQATFTLHVQAPPPPSDTTAPIISYTLSPASPDGSNSWYRSNVSLLWNVTDLESAVTKTGCVDQTITADQGATTYSCSASSAGGSAGPMSVSIQRDATAPGLSWSGSISNGDTFVYGSVPAAPTCSASDTTSGPAGCVVIGYDASVGPHTLSATATDAAGNSTTETRSYTVDQATATIVVNPYNVTYDGNPHTSTGTATGVNSEDLSSLLDLNGTTHTNAGAYTDNWSFAGNTNYKSATGTVDNNISQAASSTTVTVSDATYDGAPHGGTAVATGAGNLNENLTVTYAGRNTTVYGPSTDAPTNAGEYTASALFAGDDNHTSSSQSKDFTIFKAASTTTLNCPASVTYNGSAQTPCTVSTTGAGGLSTTVAIQYANNTNAGTATASANYDGDENHTGSSASQNFVIEKAATTTTVTCGAGPFMYNGLAQEPCSASVTGAGGLNQSLAVSYSNNINAGTATASASYAESANYLASSNSANFTIGKANATINVSGFTGYYDGSAHCATGTATGVMGENLIAGLNLGSCFTNVPGGTANWSFSGGTNYNNASGSVAIVINAWTLRGFYQPVDMNGVFNTVRNGSTVPLKFEIFVGTTEKTDVSYVKSLRYGSVACSAIAPVDDIETLASGNTSLRYDATAGQFIYNWKTPAGTGCYSVTMTTNDGSTLFAFFKLK
jgi:hypothetical protein